jgi:hypothetical protein
MKLIDEGIRMTHLVPSDKVGPKTKMSHVIRRSGSGSCRVLISMLLLPNKLPRCRSASSASAKGHCSDAAGSGALGELPILDVSAHIR